MSLFRGCGCAFLDSLSVLLREAQFAHEEVIFQQNEVSKELCYIITGSVERLIDVSIVSTSPQSSRFGCAEEESRI